MRYLLSMLLLTLPIPSHAGERIYGAIIENIRVRTWTAYIKLDKCTKYSKITLDNEYGKGMYSAALMAFTADKKVEVELTGAEGCDVEESDVFYIDVSRQNNSN